MNGDEYFNFSGKIPTESDFFKEYASSFVTSEGITAGFSKVLGEQVYKPLMKPITPMYNVFAGNKALSEGVAWEERLVKRKNSRKYKPKATAEDAFGFYDNAGKSIIYNKNYSGWRPETLPSKLKTAEMMLNAGGVGTLNDMFLENQIIGYQCDMEAAIEKKFVSSIKNKTTVDITDITAIRKKIRDIASDMTGSTIHYNEFTEQENKDYVTSSDRVLAFMDAKLWNDLRDSKSTLPSPTELVENVTVIPMVDGMPTPITTAEYDAGSGSVTWNASDKPIAIDEDKPEIILCSDKRCEYRPYIGSYNINVGRNPAGQFDNYHLVYEGCIAIRPYENAIRINNTA